MNTGLVRACVLSRVQLFATPQTVARQDPLSMGFPRQEYWSGLSCPLPGDLRNPGIEPVSPALAGGFFITKPPEKPPMHIKSHGRTLIARKRGAYAFKFLKGRIFRCKAVKKCQRPL